MLLKYTVTTLSFSPCRKFQFPINSILSYSYQSLNRQIPYIYIISLLWMLVNRCCVCYNFTKISWKYLKFFSLSFENDYYHYYEGQGWPGTQTRHTEVQIAESVKVVKNTVARGVLLTCHRKYNASLIYDPSGNYWTRNETCMDKNKK